MRLKMPRWSCTKARNAFVDQLNSPEEKKNVGLSYWIELDSAGQNFQMQQQMQI